MWFGIRLTSFDLSNEAQVKWRAKCPPSNDEGVNYIDWFLKYVKEEWDTLFLCYAKICSKSFNKNVKYKTIHIFIIIICASSTRVYIIM